MLTPFIFGLAIGFGICFLYRGQRIARFRRFEGGRLLSDLNWRKIWTLDDQLLNLIRQQNHQIRSLSAIQQDSRDLLDRLPIAYLQVDPENYLVYCNPITQTVLKVSPPDLSYPILLLEWVRSYDLDKLIEETRQSQVLQERDWIVNSVSLDPANPVVQRPLYLRGQSFPLSNGDIGVFIEDRYEMITLSQQQNRWVSDVAHELKTPLTSIRLVAETLLSRVNPRERAWVERLLDEVMGLSGLVKDLLDLAQLERFRGDNPGDISMQPPSLDSAVHWEAVDLVEVVYAAWETLIPLNRQKQAHLLYLGPDSLMVGGDSSRLYRAILNLLDNAIKFSPPDQDIEVSIEVVHELNPSTDIQSSFDPNRAPEPEIPWVRLHILDQGSGFPSQSLPHVFDRFYRADESRQRYQRGASDGRTGLSVTSSASCGLGLAIVKEIIKAHQGRIEAKNHPRTGGAWIQIELPQNLQATQAVPTG